MKKGILLVASLVLFLLPAVAFCGETFVIYGDTRTGHESHRAVVAAMASVVPSAVFHLGDLVEDGNDPAQWKIFNDITAPVRKTADFFPVLGNHENDSPMFFDNFTYLKGQRWYAVQRQNVVFFILDSISDISVGSQQYQWLASELKKYPASFKLVLMHYPVFNAAAAREKEHKLQEDLAPLFEQAGVSAVFSGHSHNYQRFLHKGVRYIVSGGGGAPLHGQERSSPELKKFIEKHHFCVLSPREGFIEVKVLDTHLAVMDSFLILKKNTAEGGKYAGQD